MLARGHSTGVWGPVALEALDPEEPGGSSAMSDTGNAEPTVTAIHNGPVDLPGPSSCGVRTPKENVR
jgi:hypothetical protein